jgi:uncharacterized protein (DUF2062 family)
VSNVSSHQHRRFRRAKQFLRFMPRRAVFHRYPLVGRWAALARREQYLWSFRRGPVRRAFYAGSVLAFLPFLGAQLAIGLVVAIVTRANFMVLGALQFITNPFTALPIYGATFVIGRTVLRAAGWKMGGARLPDGWGKMGVGEMIGHMDMGTAIGQGFICLMVGGLVSGLCLGVLLDGVYFLGARGAEVQKKAEAKITDPGGPAPVP